MGKRSSFHNAPPEADQRRAVEKQATRAEFARRLNRLLVQKGWSQAEFSRRASEVAVTNGTDMRIGADSISHYINGRYMPSPSHIAVLAQALSVDVLELLPAKGVPEAGESLPPVSVQDLEDGTAWLKVNQALPWGLAVKVLALLRGEEEEPK